MHNYGSLIPISEVRGSSLHDVPFCDSECGKSARWIKPFLDILSLLPSKPFWTGSWDLGPFGPTLLVPGPNTYPLPLDPILKFLSIFQIQSRSGQEDRVPHCDHSLHAYIHLWLHYWCREHDQQSPRCFHQGKILLLQKPSPHHVDEETAISFSKVFFI